jgi:hypothetical protein
MKKLTTYLSVTLLAILLFTACKKNDTVNPDPAKSTFTLNGNVYTETASVDSVGTLGSSANKINIFAVSGIGADGKALAVLEFIFLGPGKPTAGTYNVIADASKMTAGQVGIIAQDKVSIAKQGLYSSMANGSITVTVNAAGKISVSLPNAIPLTGSNFDNTDPKNTVITNVTATVSGTASEQ